MIRRFDPNQMLVERSADPSTSLRSGRDDKGEGGASIRIRCWLRELQIPPLRFAPVGMTKYMYELTTQDTKKL
jgi:hypothetical protein